LFAFEFNEEINSSCTTPLSPVSLTKGFYEDLKHSKKLTD